MGVRNPQQNVSRLFVALFLAASQALAPRSADAQVIRPVADPVAERHFLEGVEHFEAEEFDAARASFAMVVENPVLNTRTTAALLMAGKSSYRSGAFDQAARTLRALIDRFPESRYVSEAQEILEWARSAEDHEPPTPPLTLGVLLPTSDDDITLSQSLFTGVRIAVDSHNAADSLAPVRMVFRRSDGSDMQEVMAEFKALEASVVLGPLYSSEALEASEAAERFQLTLVAPLATDEGVAQGREFVFQANPTPTMRGRAMARFAVESLRLDTFTVVAQNGNNLSERMAEGFQDEALQLGAQVPFYYTLPSTSAWFRLGEYIDADTLEPTGVKALYLPIAGGQAQSLIKAAMDELDRLGLLVRLLGNKEWHNLPSKMQPSAYNTVYTNDFYATDDSVAAGSFVARYKELADEPPNELAYVGFDLARYLITLLTSDGDGPLPDALRRAPRYQGLALRLEFGGGNVNQALYFQRYRNGNTELLY